MEEGIVKSGFYPFKKYKVSKFHEETIKRAIIKDEVMKVINYQKEDKDIENCFHKESEWYINHSK